MSGKKMWGGRFTGSVDPVFEAFSESVSFDKELALMDLAGSRAHAKVLLGAGILDESEHGALCKGLDAVEAEVRAGEFVWRVELEDVHMNIERRLTELAGPVGGKVHTGRSRNDQVALDFRLHVNERLHAWQQGLAGLVASLADRAGEHVDTLLPGCTHLQPAQPVSLAQHLLAYVQMFRRDHERVGDSLKRVRVSPLGAAALAGNTLGLDPSEAARAVGFDRAFANSMDAVSDRDFAAEALFDAALVMTHLSRLCEEIIMWASPRYGFVKLPDAYATGSSIMPQKKNPDAAELIRGKTGRVYGALVTLLTVLKGLPLTYNRDLQEDKEPFFDADRTVSMSLAIAASMVSVLGFDVQRMAQAVGEGFLNATELADYLARKGLPFRQAHEVAGKAVALAESRGKRLEELELADLQALDARIEVDVFQALGYAEAVKRRSAPGGTGPEPVKAQLAAAQEWLEGLADG